MGFLLTFHGSDNSADEMRDFRVVGVDAQRFVDAAGGPGGGHGERDAIGAGRD